MATVATAKERTVARLPTRRAGHVRFKKLLEATDSLVAEMSIQDIGLYQIAERAQVPTASVYHFFPTKEAALLALAAEHHGCPGQPGSRCGQGWLPLGPCPRSNAGLVHTVGRR